MVVAHHGLRALAQGQRLVEGVLVALEPEFLAPVRVGLELLRQVDQRLDDLGHLQRAIVVAVDRFLELLREPA